MNKRCAIKLLSRLVSIRILNLKRHSQVEGFMAGKSQKAVDFESAMAELERIVADMEAGKLSLEDSLVAYKRGAELLSFCRTRLEDAQQQVRVLEEGVLKDFSGMGEPGQS
jgi:exodeoxyribonuclease VII small subunit